MSRRAVEAGDVQAQRARNPRPGQGPRGQYAPRNNTFDVTPEPVDFAGFSFKRVAAFQCVSTELYTLPESCHERNYFTKKAACALLAFNDDSHAPKPLLLGKFCEVVGPKRDAEEDLLAILHLRNIKYGQLQKCINFQPDLNVRDPPANDPTYVPEELYESFDANVRERQKEVTKKFVQAPISEGGWFAELATPRNIMFKLALEFEVRIEYNEDEDGDGPYQPPLVYGFRLEYGQRTKACVYNPQQSHKDNIIKLTVGHFNAETNRLVPWKCTHGKLVADFLALKNDGLAHALFDQNKWPEEEDPAAEMEVEVQEVGGAGSSESRGRFLFETVNDRLCYLKEDKEGSKIEVANFTIPKVLALYQFTEAGELPLFKLLCSLRLAPLRADGTDRVIRIEAEQEQRSPNLAGYTLLEVEAIVCVCTLKSPQEVKAAFQSAHAKLQADAFTPEMLSCYLNSIEQPNPSAVIVRWGKQASGWWVLHNCAFRDGEMDSVEGSGHAIAPAYFNRNPHYPMPTHDFPKIIVIPFKHVRYVIGLDFWAYVMPAFFQNNEQPAKAVFALAVLGLHADRCWKGETGIGHGMPVGWIHSPEHGTGKTEAMRAGHAMLGFNYRAIWAVIFLLEDRTHAA